MTTKDLAAALEIFNKYASNKSYLDETEDNAWLDAAHDQIFIDIGFDYLDGIHYEYREDLGETFILDGGPIQGEDLEKLKEMDWFIDSESSTWTHFC